MEQKLIPGVFNYCNRWCERCALAHRCMLRVSELEMNEIEDPAEYLANLTLEDDPEDENTDDTEAEDVIEFIPELDEVESADDAMASFKKREEEIERLMDENAVVKESKVAGDLIDMLLNRSKSLMAKEPPLSTDGLTWHQQQKVEGEAHRTQNLLDILGWYRYMLQVKTTRAVSGKMEFDDDFEDPIQNDSNGSAKVIMIGANHCIKAAKGLLALMPALEDELLLLLTSLQKYLKLMEAEFPNAMQFIRPGFDTLNITEDLGA